MTSSELSSLRGSLPNLSMPIAELGDRSILPSGENNSSDNKASIDFGLPYRMSLPLDENGIPVPRQDLNAFYNLLSRVVHYIMAGGKIPWMQGEANAIGGYPAGAEVSYGGHIYKSLVDSNTANPSDSSKWKNVDHLPLSGGTMSGPIVGDPEAHLLTGSNDYDGAGLQLFKRNHVSSPGKFCLRSSTKSASDDTSGKSADLVGDANNKTLSWDGRNVITASSIRYIEVVSALPSSPDENTLYLIRGIQ